MRRYKKFYKFMEDYLREKSKNVFYDGYWRRSYSPSAGNEKIKKALIRDLIRNCTGSEIKLFLSIVDSLPETDNPYESQVVKIVAEDWAHILTGKYFRQAINMYLQLGYLTKAPLRSVYVVDPHLWCKTKESIIVDQRNLEDESE